MAACMTAPLCALGCSLLGLDRLPYTRCNGDDGCDALNDRIDADACVGWECHSGYCRLRERDADRDGRVRATCPTGDDCDDHDAAIGPHVREVCDGFDQDCDFAIDEELASLEAIDPPTPITLVALSSPSGATSIRAEDRGATATFVDGAASMHLEHLTSLTPVALSAALALAVQPGDATSRTRGCARISSTPIPPDPSCVDSTDCGPGETCAARADGVRVCGSGTATCVTDAECGDGVACNGAERCLPASPLSDARGCAPGMRACAAGETCDEEAQRCLASSVFGSCMLDDVAVAPVGGDTWVAAAIARTCAAGSVRIAHLLEGDAERLLLSVGDGSRSSSWDGVDVDGSGCTGASRPSGSPGARGPAVAALAADGSRTPQGLVAYLAAPADAVGSAPVEVLGVWLERDAAGLTWTHASGSGMPSTLGAVATGSTRRPAMLSVEAGVGSVFLVAYGAEGGGVALFVVGPLGEPGPECAETPTEPCVGPGADGPLTLIPAAFLGLERTSEPLDDPAALALAGAMVDGDVSLALRAAVAPSTTVEIAVAYLEAGEVVVALGTLEPATRSLTFTDARTQRIPAERAEVVSISRIAVGLTSEGEDRARGGYVVTWSGPSGTFVTRIRDGQPSHGPVVRIWDTRVEAPRATLLDEGLAIVGRTNAGLVAFRYACGRVVP